MAELSPEVIALKEEGNVRDWLSPRRHKGTNDNSYQTAFRKQNFNVATEKYKAAIALAPDSAILYSNLAASLSSQGKLDDSLDASLKSIEVRQETSNSLNATNLSLSLNSWILLDISLMSAWLPYTSDLDESPGLWKLVRRSSNNPFHFLTDTAIPPSGQKAVSLATDPQTKSAAKLALSGLLRRNMNMLPPNQQGTIPDKLIDPKSPLQNHPALRAAQLQRQGKVVFDPFSEGARVYASFARFAELNQVRRRNS